MVVPVWPHAAEVTETQVIGGGRIVMKTTTFLQPSDLPSSLRIHGDVVLAHGRRKINNSVAGWSMHGFFYHDRQPFDHRVPVADVAVFRNYDACCDLIHETLSNGPVTGDYDLAPANWGDYPQPPMDFAMEIGRLINSSGPGVQRFDVDIHLPELVVCSLYSEPLELIRACKEEGPAAAAPAAPGEVCTLCFMELDPGDAGTVRLPCFHAHAFHTPCISPWFHLQSTCPICRHDIVDFFQL